MLGVATRRGPFNRRYVADITNSMVSGGTLVRDCGRRSIYFRRRMLPSMIQGCDEGFRLDQLNFRRTFVVSVNMA